jgi:4-hydroxybenzoate polyprenyltransferase
MWNWIFSAVGLLLSFYVSWKTKIFSILIFNSFSVVLLWFYSTTFKKKLLVGNILISLLTSWTIIVIYIFAGASLINYSGWDVVHFPFNIKRLYKLTIIYSGFAFIVSLIREVIKDLEDMQGDAQFNCKTMPIIWGVPASKVFIAVWIVVCVCSLAIIQLYAWQTGFWISAIYVIVAIIIPLLLVLKKLRLAEIPSDYHKISIFLKIIMLAGILSMLFFKII